MSIPFIIIFVTLLIYLPLAGALIYVWWKYGSHEIGVSIARVIFILGSLVLFTLMLIV